MKDPISAPRVSATKSSRPHILPGTKNWCISSVKPYREANKTARTKTLARVQSLVDEIRACRRKPSMEYSIMCSSIGACGFTTGCGGCEIEDKT